MINFTLPIWIRFLKVGMLSLLGWVEVIIPVQAACTFSNTTPGQIIRSSSGFKAMESSAGLLGGSDGMTGQVTLDCTNGGALLIAQPNRINAPSSFIEPVTHALVQLDNTSFHTFVSNGGGQFPHAPWIGRSSAPLKIPPGVHLLTTGIIVGELVSGFLPSGTYTYRAALTIVPN